MDLTADDVMTLKVSELKAKLIERSLPTNGIKSALQKRLLAALGGAESAPAETTGMEVEKDTGPKEEIDETVRYQGTVFAYLKRRGFGRIIPEGKTEEDKDDFIFVHWKQIQSSDEWPALQKGQKVEYYLGKKLNPKDPKKANFAAKVTLPGGEQVNIADTRNFPDRNQRFTGTVDFFNAYKGFGFIKPNEDFAFEETDFLASKKGTIYVCREDIKVADDVDSSPSLKDKAEVEFALYKVEEEDKKTKWAAGDVTKVGGDPLGTEDFKPKRPRGEKRKRSHKKGKKGKKGQKGKKGKKNQFKGGFKMGGNTFIPMNMGMQRQPQMVMMNGQAYMVMPQMGGMQMAGFGGMNVQAGRNTKRRKKNRKNKNKKKNNSNNGGSW